MPEIKCPKCGEVFEINEASYAAIVTQVRNKEFEKQVKERTESAVKEAEAKKDKVIAQLQHDAKIANKQIEIEVARAKKEKDEEISEYESRITGLKERLEADKNTYVAEREKQIAILKSEYNEKVNKLESKLEAADKEKEYALQQEANKFKDEMHKKEEEKHQIEKDLIQVKAFAKEELTEERQKHSVVVQALQDEIKREREMKLRLSTKMVGESLERHCESEFDRVRAIGFQNALFMKDNDDRSGTKGDFIFRDFDDNGEEYISIMFEMKNEMEETAAKHKNEDFFKKLDKDRKDKNCEYAVLVSTLEPDNDFYNSGIVEVSQKAKYDKMYVVRPQCFLTIISILRNAAQNTIVLKKQLKIKDEEDRDYKRFNDNFSTFRDQFLKYGNRANERNQEAIKQIEDAIKKLQKVKDSLQFSDKALQSANKLVGDTTIKGLTTGARTIRDRFLEEGIEIE